MSTSTISGSHEPPSTLLRFDTGDIILEINDTQFRVHSVLLAIHSNTLAGQIAALQAKDASIVAVVDGCRVLRVHGGTATSWENLLCAMYGITEPAPRWSPVEPLAGMIRIAIIYKFDHLLVKAAHQLKAQFPGSLQEFDFWFKYTGTANGLQAGAGDAASTFKAWFRQNGMEILQLAEDVGFWSILPVSYYMALTVDEDFLERNSASMSHVLALTLGRARICQDVILHGLKWAIDIDGIPCTSCCGRLGQCVKALGEFLDIAFKALKVEGVQFALTPWDHLNIVWRYSHPGLCRSCKDRAVVCFDKGRAYIWDNLPYYFLGDGWRECKDFDINSAPPNWKRPLHKMRVLV